MTNSKKTARRGHALLTYDSLLRIVACIGLIFSQLPASTSGNDRRHADIGTNASSISRQEHNPFPASSGSRIWFVAANRPRRAAGRRRGPRGRKDIERERLELWRRTSDEIDAIVAEYHRRLSRQNATSIGVVYARYSTRFQDSIADQVRAILDDAVRLGVFVPRQNVFFDLATRGVQVHRTGLAQVEKLLETKKVQVLLLFSTSRLFRKQFRTLAFVDKYHKERGIRCIFVKSGVDTDDAQRWEVILNTQAMVDQFVVSMHVANVHAAHQGLLEQGIVFGTLPLLTAS